MPSVRSRSTSGLEGVGVSDDATGPNYAGLVARAAHRHGDRLALVGGDRRLTWAEVEAEVAGRAAGLVALGLRPGARLALLLPNTLDFPVHLFAALRAGLVVVPLNTGYTAPEVHHQLADSGASAVVTDEDGARLLAEIRADLPELRHVLRPEAIGVPDLPPVVTAPTGGEDLAVVVYTSGTSGRPRGAMLSHRALLANLEQLGAIDPVPVTERDVVLQVLPLFHIYGLNVGLGMQTWAGATGVLVERFDPQACLLLMAEERVTTVVGAPPMYVVWARGDRAALRAGWAHVRVALSGAAPLPAGVLATLREATGVEVHEGYGLTETAPVLTSTLVGGEPKPGSIGRPVPRVELELRDDDGEPVRADEDGGTGQITVRGPNLFSGYWPDGADGPDADGWLETGDIGFLDDDGDLHLVDRMKDLILVSGFNVYPQEVEAVLLGHPGVREVAVVAGPDDLTGETVRAIVVPTPGAEPTEAELRAHCRAELARFKVPTRISFVPELPHSVTGKVSRSRLRELGLA